MATRTLGVLLLLAALASAEELEPKRTYAVVVGVLRWQDPATTAYSEEQRKDVELHDTLLHLGVPREQTRLLLDTQATRAAVVAAVREVAALAGPEATLLFYYAGHGALVDDAVVFLPYDYAKERPAETGLAVSALGELLREHFRGAQLLLLGDCCHSGGLAKVAAGSGKRAASLTSAEDCNVSTANWTYTLALLDALRGEAIADRDADGHVTLGEAAEEVAGAMKFRERQRSGFATHGLPPDLRLAKARGGARPPKVPGPYAYRDYVAHGESVARVVGHRDGKYEVQLQGYVARRNVLCAADDLGPLGFARYPAGAEIRVLWGDKTWDARVERADGDFHWITYPGWSHAWDEWVLSDRIVGTKVPPEPLPQAEAKERARCGGKYARLVKVLEVAADHAQFGAFKDYGFEDMAEWGGHKDLPVGYWVYVYPRWFIWAEEKGKPALLGRAEALEKARCGGKYDRLLRTVRVPKDVAEHGAFKEAGLFEASDYAGHTGIPQGYWVYVYPNWYVWGDARG